jgi:hypothetical protein
VKATTLPIGFGQNIRPKMIMIKKKKKTKEGIEGILEMNPGLESSTTREEKIQMLKIALLCTSKNPVDRPSMRDVVSMIQEVGGI